MSNSEVAVLYDQRTQDTRIKRLFSTCRDVATRRGSLGDVLDRFVDADHALRVEGDAARPERGFRQKPNTFIIVCYLFFIRFLPATSPLRNPPPANPLQQCTRESIRGEAFLGRPRTGDSPNPFPGIKALARLFGRARPTEAKDAKSIHEPSKIRFVASPLASAEGT